MRVVILKGLPGSGKSTLVKTLTKDYSRYQYKICSADNYWIRPDGIYDWNPKYIKNAHEWCQRSFKSTIITYDLYRSNKIEECYVELLIVDNTNLTKEERKVYVEWCKTYKIPYEILEPQTKWRYDVEECAKRNVHGVPIEAIQRMKDKLFKDIGLEMKQDT